MSNKVQVRQVRHAGSRWRPFSSPPGAGTAGFGRCYTLPLLCTITAKVLRCRAGAAAAGAALSATVLTEKRSSTRSGMEAGSLHSAVPTASQAIQPEASLISSCRRYQ